MLDTRKVRIVGVGHVGSHCALSMLLQGVCDELLFFLFFIRYYSILKMIKIREWI